MLFCTVAVCVCMSIVCESGETVSNVIGNATQPDWSLEGFPLYKEPAPWQEGAGSGVLKTVNISDGYNATGDYYGEGEPAVKLTLSSTEGSAPQTVPNEGTHNGLLFAAEFCGVIATSAWLVTYVKKRWYSSVSPKYINSSPIPMIDPDGVDESKSPEPYSHPDCPGGAESMWMKADSSPWEATVPFNVTVSVATPPAEQEQQRWRKDEEAVSVLSNEGSIV